MIILFKKNYRKALLLDRILRIFCLSFCFMCSAWSSTKFTLLLDSHCCWIEFLFVDAVLLLFTESLSITSWLVGAIHTNEQYLISHSANPPLRPPNQPIIPLLKRTPVIDIKVYFLTLRLIEHNTTNIYRNAARGGQFRHYSYCSIEFLYFERKTLEIGTEMFGTPLVVN